MVSALAETFRAVLDVDKDGPVLSLYDEKGKPLAGQAANKAAPATAAEVKRVLSEAIDLDFEKTSLDNVLKYIGEVQRGLNLVIDPDIAAANIDLSTIVVDLKVKHVSIEEVLKLIIGGNLGYAVQPGYILITTKEKASKLAAEATTPTPTAGPAVSPPKAQP